MFSPGFLRQAAISSAGLRPAPLGLGPDRNLLTTMEFAGRSWKVALDTAATYLLYEDVVSRAGLVSKVNKMKTGTTTLGTDTYLIAPELLVGGVSFGKKVVPTGVRITDHEDGLVGGNLFDNSIVCVSVANRLIGIGKVADEPSQEDLNVFAPEKWDLAQQLYGQYRWKQAAALFEAYAAMFRNLRGHGALNAYLAGRLMQASALINNSEDAMARAILAEIQLKDPTFQVDKVRALIRALR